MGKSTIKSQRIETFENFCKAQNKKQIQENNEVAIDVPFYEEAVSAILGELKQVAGDPLDWRTLIDYIKTKFHIIDREIPGSDEFLVVAHVRDLLFQRYGDSFLGGAGCITGNTATIGAKSLVLSQLASDILKKVRVEAGIELPPEPEIAPKPLSTVSLNNTEDFDDDFFYDESRRVTMVADFNDYSNMLKESVDRISVQHDKKALDYCLDKIKKAAGSLKLKDILTVVEDEETTLNAYLTGIAEDYLENSEIELNGNRLENKGDQKLILKQAKKLFAHEIAKELTDRIQKETK